LLPPPLDGDDQLYRSHEVLRRDTVNLPCVVVGGTWSTRTEFERAAVKLRYASPFEVLAAVRKEAMRSGSGR
jgi:hypothetical protein